MVSLSSPARILHSDSDSQTVFFLFTKAGLDAALPGTLFFCFFYGTIHRDYHDFGFILGFRASHWNNLIARYHLARESAEQNLQSGL